MLADALLACALMVHPVTLDKVVQVESRGSVSALHVNGIADKDQPHPKDAADAIVFAQRYIAAGRSVDLGIMQINSRNLQSLGLTVEQALTDSCANIHAGGTILATGYSKAVTVYGEGQMALQAALSAYNTGDLQRGFRNAYVAKYYAVPALSPEIRSKSSVVPAAFNRHASDTEVWE